LIQIVFVGVQNNFEQKTLFSILPCKSNSAVTLNRMFGASGCPAWGNAWVFQDHELVIEIVAYD
jgi:hypothetical protein